MALIIGLPEKEIQKVNKDLYELQQTGYSQLSLIKISQIKVQKEILHSIWTLHYREKHSRIFLYTYTHICSAFNSK